MVRGLGKIKTKEGKKKTAMQKDIERTKDIASAYLQGGKAIGNIVKTKSKKEKKKK